MDYDEAMTALNDAVYAAVRAADNHDGAPVHDLRELAAEIDCLIDHGCTRAHMKDMEALYRGAKLAGLV
ncbi:MAG: hypothetical protein AB3N13_12130 [Arenibacterium sp.]